MLTFLRIILSRCSRYRDCLPVSCPEIGLRNLSRKDKHAEISRKVLSRIPVRVCLSSDSASVYPIRVFSRIEDSLYKCKKATWTIERVFWNSDPLTFSFRSKWTGSKSLIFVPQRVHSGKRISISNLYSLILASFNPS